jgi:hypothetical protein
MNILKTGVQKSTSQQMKLPTKEMNLENTAASEIETKPKLWHENMEPMPVEIVEAAEANKTGR